jgi:hypothetical protein
MNAMPSLNGSVGYIFTSCDLDVKASGNVRFKDMIERFRVYDQPRRPEAKEEEWLGGELVEKRGMCLVSGTYTAAKMDRRLSSLRTVLSSYWTARRTLFYTTYANAASASGSHLTSAFKFTN